MLILGLTGSIGMGKSTAAARIREHGFAVFDADAEVHRLYSGPLAADIEKAFPGTATDGQVDRAKLAAALIREPSRFADLEAIVHPKVRESERRFLQAEHAKGADFAVLEVPLLFESGIGSKVDVTIVVSAPPEIQRQRVLARPGMTEAKLATVVKRQLSEAEKLKRADFIVDTSASVENCNAQIDALLAKLKDRRGNAFERYWRKGG